MSHSPAIQNYLDLPLNAGGPRSKPNVFNYCATNKPPTATRTHAAGLPVQIAPPANTVIVDLPSGATNSKASVAEEVVVVVVLEFVRALVVVVVGVE